MHLASVLAHLHLNSVTNHITDQRTLTTWQQSAGVGQSMMYPNSDAVIEWLGGFSQATYGRLPLILFAYDAFFFIAIKIVAVS